MHVGLLHQRLSNLELESGTTRPFTHTQQQHPSLTTSTYNTAHAHTATLRRDAGSSALDPWNGLPETAAQQIQVEPKPDTNLRCPSNRTFTVFSPSRPHSFLLTTSVFYFYLWSRLQFDTFTHALYIRYRNHLYSVVVVVVVVVVFLFLCLLVLFPQPFLHLIHGSTVGL
jgi:hypothetical protein